MPNIFLQLYTIHGVYHHVVLPLVYLLFTHRTEQLYTTALMHLKVTVGGMWGIDLAPQILVVDFERAAINAFKSVFPFLKVRGCHFHFCQSILRQINNLGMKQNYENDEQFRICARMLMVLPYMDSPGLIPAYNQLKALFPQFSQPLLDYFEVQRIF